MRIENRSPFQRNGRDAYRIENKADETTVYIYDEISWWGVDAQDFVKDFNKIEAKSINIRVNSPGGSVFDGTTIFNAIKQHPSRTVAHIDGLAASIASIIVLAADEVIMAENAFMMIHEPWSMMAGSADDMRKEAELLDKVRGTIAKTYIDKSGKEEAEILNMMAEETWLTADEALEGGFVDAIGSEREEKALFDLSVFNKVPDGLKDKKVTAREVEHVLRDAGYSAKQAKGIVSEGLVSDQRDVEPETVLDPIEAVATVENEGVNIEVQRDVVAKKKPDAKESTAVLLARANRVAPPRG